jgi:hypothetical protein
MEASPLDSNDVAMALLHSKKRHTHLTFFSLILITTGQKKAEKTGEKNVVKFER